jgi:hypothetical protein
MMRKRMEKKMRMRRSCLITVKTSKSAMPTDIKVIKTFLSDLANPLLIQLKCKDRSMRGKFR